MDNTVIKTYFIILEKDEDSDIVCDYLDSHFVDEEHYYAHPTSETDNRTIVTIENDDFVDDEFMDQLQVYLTLEGVIFYTLEK